MESIRVHSVVCSAFEASTKLYDLVSTGDRDFIFLPKCNVYKILIDNINLQYPKETQEMENQ